MFQKLTVQQRKTQNPDTWELDYIYPGVGLMPAIPALQRLMHGDCDFQDGLGYTVRNSQKYIKN